LITGSAQPQRDLDWIVRHIGTDQHATVTDVSAMTAVLSVMGPKAQELLGRVSPDDLSPAALKFSFTREIDLGLARVRAARMSYVGGPGYELYVPIEMARHVYLALHEAGKDLNLADAGYYAIDALRIEAGRRAWGAEPAPMRRRGKPGWRSRSSSASRQRSSGAMPCWPRAATAAQEAAELRVQRSRGLRVGW
jgi:4-methylaminobutanoate oxidase (formaldehyde-forming)